jgi:hypothetical protein
MPNKTIDDENVKWFSKNKYPCKRNKGQHEWGKPKVMCPACVRYLYKTKSGDILDAGELQDENRYRFIKAELLLSYEVRCIHCGKKELILFRDKIN